MHSYLPLILKDSTRCKIIVLFCFFVFNRIEAVYNLSVGKKAHTQIMVIQITSNRFLCEALACIVIRIKGQ